ncbi:uncharacterized protein SCHCODRAFT_02750445 [Schizophyllum commune H4-8]|uniref:uncharacterized protein n=1 Tax=Schizophyllum commune (strain H4-8 / FGSC 9210) TaxID=578458 RepID=UPI00215E5D38|nr:uncharacterized protein SCHCODRAFT_02750445 [Schizophyllum commune H4-8]KAI5890722.1 hypothetical protein SCHCODRAFT_02750445 [Schizophyllum commune H4-8]
MSLETSDTPWFLKLPVELLQKICRGLQGIRVDKGESDKHLARLALTCRALYLVANPILWESLPGLEPLLDLMPPEAWDESVIKARYETPKGSASKARHLPDFWAPVRKLADLVRHISIFPIPSRYQTMIMLARPSQKLLPRATRVILDQDRKRKLEFKNGSIDHYLKFLKFIIPFSGILDLDLSMDHIHTLALRQARFPQLESLICHTIDFDMWPGAVIDAFQHRDAQLDLARSVTGLQHLRHLDMLFPFGPDAELFEGLGRFRHLSCLSVVFEPVGQTEQTVWIGRRSKYPADAFPALESLQLEGVSFTDAAALLQSCAKRPSLRYIAIRSAGMDTPAALLALTETIKRVCDPAVLAGVHLRRYPLSVMRDFDDSSYDWLLTFEHVEPLAALSSLETVVFGVFCEMTITEEQWAHLERCWPNLLIREVLIL